MSTTCTVGTCNEQPVDGSTYCYMHVPIADRDGLPASVCPGCGKTVTPETWDMHPRYCRGRAAERVESGGEPVTSEPSPPPLQPSGQSITIACAVGPCDNQRVSGTSYCAKHGPMTGRNAPRYYRTSKTPSASKTPSDAPGASQILCPHCQVRGRVQTKRVKVKRGISGGKATGAWLTGGVSLWVTGLSHKEKTTQATCGNCHVTWMI